MTFEAALAAPLSLVAAPAGTSSDTAPWPAGVTSTVQVNLSEVRKPEAVPLVMTRSASSKPVTGWLKLMVKGMRVALVGLGEDDEVDTLRPSVDFVICAVTRGPAAPSFEMMRIARVSVPSGSPETSIPEIACGSLSIGPAPDSAAPPPELLIW